MGRTMLNVAGTMVSAIVVDKWDGTFNREIYDAPMKASSDEE